MVNRSFYVSSWPVFRHAVFDKPFKFTPDSLNHLEQAAHHERLGPLTKTVMFVTVQPHKSVLADLSTIRERPPYVTENHPSYFEEVYQAYSRYTLAFRKKDSLTSRVTAVLSQLPAIANIKLVPTWCRLPLMGDKYLEHCFATEFKKPPEFRARSTNIILKVLKDLFDRALTTLELPPMRLDRGPFRDLHKLNPMRVSNLKLDLCFDRTRDPRHRHYEQKMRDFLMLFPDLKNLRFWLHYSDKRSTLPEYPWFCQPALRAARSSSLSLEELTLVCYPCPLLSSVPDICELLRSLSKTLRHLKLSLRMLSTRWHTLFTTIKQYLELETLYIEAPRHIRVQSSNSVPIHSIMNHMEGPPLADRVYVASSASSRTDVDVMDSPGLFTDVAKRADYELWNGRSPRNREVWDPQLLQIRPPNSTVGSGRSVRLIM
ncbi:uncharacterized protein K452DRAFT_301548 [Aplosporella prunicola CBS 121167]|uniref:Uncharacterized protein n=1 Tax=Aplosporella prunicola CBS 121167 TaxID=1176127 RepID=A0A6A6B3I1_9PEZI|nr:uncharacterized protein K452DRAFT_301548 [Aplosporella prunicola CBS 121167]KAF2137815.1 hypothetical protein K452DRAFT_301548 [Aplosporella prunicola CBS 121167]